MSDEPSGELTVIPPGEASTRTEVSSVLNVAARRDALRMINGRRRRKIIPAMIPRAGIRGRSAGRCRQITFKDRFAASSGYSRHKGGGLDWGTFAAGRAGAAGRTGAAGRAGTADPSRIRETL